MCSKAGAIALLAALAALAGCASAPSESYLTTKTPYRPRQAVTAYTAPPAGFTAVHTQLVARHGTRGMTSMKDDLALLNMCRDAARENALTPLGKSLMADVQRLIEVQLLLGAGIDGIAKPGYANLTQIGIDEHRDLARRLVQRLPALFATADGGAIVVKHSGVDRARDSAYFFTQALAQAAPAVAPAIAPAQTDRFTLYFHKLSAKVDGTPARSDPHLAVLEDSQRYQRYLDSPRLQQRLDAMHHDARLQAAARVTLERLFSKEFVDRLAAGAVRFANTGTMEAASPDGKFRAKAEGKGTTVIASPVDALMALSAVYEIAPGLRSELNRDFRPYIADEQARLLAWANDAEDFYVKGPAMRADAPVTYAMAQGLLNEFFDEAENRGTSHRATLRFSHAEIIMPLSTLLGLPGSRTPLAEGRCSITATTRGGAARWPRMPPTSSGTVLKMPREPCWCACWSTSGRRRSSRPATAPASSPTAIFMCCPPCAAAIRRRL